MKVTCDECNKEYSIPEDRIPEKGAVFKCKVCGAKIEVSRPPQMIDSQLMQNKFFTFAKPYLSFIDNGDMFRKPFSWLYILFAVLNLILPLFILYKLIEMRIFSAGGTAAITFILFWIILAFSSWICFQIWWDRKSKLSALMNKKDEEFVATPVLSHFIQTMGESLGTYIAIVGFGFALLTTIFLSGQGGASIAIGLPFVSGGLVSIIMSPIIGFLVIVVSRFFSEQITVFAAIANNTKK